MQNKSIVVPLKNGKKLVVDVYGAEPGCNNDEISVCIVDEDDCYMQDIVLVRESLDKENIIETLVYSDMYNEDYTHKFNIGIYEEGEEDGNN